MYVLQKTIHHAREIAYLRFASVSHAFNSLDDFARAIDTLRQRSQEKAQASNAHS